MTTQTEDIRAEERDGVVTVTFTRPRKLNAVNKGMLDVLRTAVHAVGDREDLRVLVITGEGPYFTAGIDIGGLGGEGVGADGTVQGTIYRRGYRQLHLVFDEIEAIEKPVVLAAQGHCFGFGVELASSCDFRFAAQSSVFWLPEVPNLAALPGSGGMSRLTRLVGPQWAKWMALAGRKVDADKALQIGFVHEVFPDEQFPEQVRAFAQDLVGLSREAIGLAKLAIDAADAVDRTTARNIDRLANSLLIDSADHKAMLERFNRPKPAP
jgi:enoyl-CoA hydratase/carnithine racemase